MGQSVLSGPEKKFQALSAYFGWWVGGCMDPPGGGRCVGGFLIKALAGGFGSRKTCPWGSVCESMFTLMATQKSNWIKFSILMVRIQV